MILKDELFNRGTVEMLATRITDVYPNFQHEAFITDCIKGFPSLELKQRMSHVTLQLYKYISLDYTAVLEIFYKAFQSLEQGHFVYGAVLEYIQEYGCTDDYVDLSLQALGDLTHILSAEFAIRPYINKYPVKTLQYAMTWTTSDNVHVRRLASEGTRPLLPWGGKVDLDYHKTEPILDALYNDSEEYVVRSVANHLNDISKIDPMYVIDKLSEWKDANNSGERTLSYIDRHSLRTLLKQGYPAAIEYMGYPLDPDLDHLIFELESEEISIGDRLYFTLTFQSNESINLMIDYIVTYPTKHGKTTTKVYKWKNTTIEKGKRYSFKGNQSFQSMSTRTMRPGRHEIGIQINGKLWKNQAFTLVE